MKASELAEFLGSLNLDIPGNITIRSLTPNEAKELLIDIRMQLVKSGLYDRGLDDIREILLTQSRQRQGRIQRSR